MAGLPWIKAHVDLPRHHKSIRLAARLEDPRAWTWVVGMWFWAAEYQPEGIVECPDAELIIARGSGWTGNPEDFVRHLVSVGFLDRTPGGYAIHDWEQYAGAHVAKRRKDKDRKRKSRGGHAEVTRTSDGRREESEGGRDESAREREIERETEATTHTLARAREAGAADKAAIEAKHPRPATPSTDQVMLALRAAGKAPNYPAAASRASVEAAIAEVGVPIAASRILAAWTTSKPWLTYYLEAITGHTGKGRAPDARGAAAPSPPEAFKTTDTWENHG